MKFALRTASSGCFDPPWTCDCAQKPLWSDSDISAPAEFPYQLPVYITLFQQELEKVSPSMLLHDPDLPEFPVLLFRIQEENRVLEVLAKASATRRTNPRTFVIAGVDHVLKRTPTCEQNKYIILFIMFDACQ